VSGICIVGAGITGLVIAHELDRAGVPCTILDKQPMPGGAIQSVRKNDFLLEYGANSMIATPELLALSAELGLESKFCFPDSSAKKRFIARRTARGGFELVAAPKGVRSFITSPLLTSRGKLRTLLEAFSGSSDCEDESVQQFFARHFGEEFTNVFVAAFANGIWAGDIRQISARSAFPKLWQLQQDYRSIMFGYLAGAMGGSRKTASHRGLLSFDDGLQSLPLKIIERLRFGRLRTLLNVDSVEDTGRGYRLHCVGSDSAEKIECDTLVLTSGAAHLAQLLSPLAPELAQAVGAIPYSPLGTLHLAVPKSAVAHPLDGFGMLLPPLLGKTLLGCVFSSSLFRARAPEGYHLLSCFAGGVLAPDRADARLPEVQQAVFSELDDLLGFKKKPELLEARYLPAAIAQYPVDHWRCQEAIREFEQEKGNLFVASSSLNGISVGDRIRDAVRTAQSVLDRVQDQKNVAAN